DTVDLIRQSHEEGDMKLPPVAYGRISLGLTRTVAATVRSIRSNIGGLVLLAISALAGYLVYEVVFGKREPSWSGLGKLLLVIGVPLILIGAVQARRRVVVEEFTDHSRSDPSTPPGSSNQSSPPAPGLATLLVVRLARLSQ